MTKQNIGLDYIRFVTAALVAFFHLAYWSWVELGRLHTSRLASGGLVQFPELQNVASVGWIGVEIFFVISGLVIAGSANGVSGLTFLKRRILRLYPAVWICATLSLPVVLTFWGVFPTLEAYVRTLVIYWHEPWLDVVYWTLVIEIFFYGFIFILLTTNSFRNLIWFAYLLTLMSISYNSDIFFNFGLIDPYMHWTVAVFCLFQHGCYFAIGIFIWYSFEIQWKASNVVFFGLAVLAAFAEIANTAPTRGSDAFAPTAIWIASVIALCLSAKATKSAIKPSSSIARTLGLMTFPLYLLHDTFGGKLMAWIFELTNSRYIALICALIGCAGVSFVVVRYLEPRLRLWLSVPLDAVLQWIAEQKFGSLLARKPSAVSESAPKGATQSG